MEPIRIELDLDKEPRELPPVLLWSGESRNPPIRACVTLGGELFDLSGYTVTCEGILPEGGHFSVGCATDGSYATAYVPESVTARARRIETAYFALEKDGVRATTQDFRIITRGGTDID